ncbi:hypothetical protein KRMM14A1004_58320 [Krasilnikovia sp. MM14-A1004]
MISGVLVAVGGMFWVLLLALAVLAVAVVRLAAVPLRSSIVLLTAGMYAYMLGLVATVAALRSRPYRNLSSRYVLGPEGAAEPSPADQA